MKNIEQLNKVVRPAGRDGARSHRVLERQVPTDNPSEYFTQCRVSVGIGTPRQGNHCGELRVA